MTGPHQSDDSIERYQKLMAILEANLKYLRTVMIEDEVLDVYKELLRYLQSRPDDKILELIGKKRPSAHQTKNAPFRLNEDEIRSMSAEQVRELASDPKVSRRELEQVASIRFAVTRGGLSNLRTREALVQKLLTLIGNETTHDSIARVVDAASPQSKD